MKLLMVNTSSEIYSILKIFDSCFSPSISSILGDLKEYSFKLFKLANVKVLINNDEKIGFYAIYCNDLDSKTAFIAQICVKCSGCGYGNILMNDIVDTCKNSGMIKIRLEVYDDNVNAIKFYKKNGFVFESVAKNGLSSYYIKEI